MSIAPAAMVSINPKHPVSLAGRGGPARVTSRIHDGVEANVVLLPCADGRSIAIVALDALFGSVELREAIITRTANDAIADVVLMASHSHNTPCLDPAKLGLGGCDMAHFATIAQDIADTLLRLVARRSDANATLHRGAHHCDANANRRRRSLRLTAAPPFVKFGTFLLPNRDVDTPSQIDIWLARDDDGAPLWLIWSWPCHATSFHDNLAISADFPGLVRAALRSALGVADLPILYFPGFCGDIRADNARTPLHWKRRLSTPFARPFAECTAENFAALGVAVAAAARAAIADATPLCIVTRNAQIARGEIDFADVMQTPNQGTITLVRIECDALSMLLMGAETCSPYYALLAPHLPEGALLSGYADAVPLYLPSDSQIAEGGYEVDGFRHSFGLPGAFFDTIEDTVVRAVAALKP